MSTVLLDDPAGVLPTGTEALLSAYVRTLRIEDAAELAGMPLDHAQQIMFDPAVKPITTALVDALLDHVAKHGGRLVDLEERSVDVLLSGAIEPRITHDEWVLSQAESVDIRKCRTASA